MYNESWSKTHVIMSDKDLNKMDAFSNWSIIDMLVSNIKIVEALSKL